MKYTRTDFIMEVSDTYMQGRTQRVTGNGEERSFGRRLMHFLIGQVQKNWTKAKQKQIWQNYDKGI